MNPDATGRCVRGEPSGETVPWSPADAPDPDNWCRPLDRFGGRVNMTIGGVTMRCEEGYLADPDSTARGCHDRYGRRYQWDGGRWVEQSLVDRARDFSGWWYGLCPPKLRTCEAQPTSTPASGGTCSLPAMPECGSVGNVDPVIGLYGCCVTDQHPNFPRRAPISGVLDEVQEAEEREATVPRDRDGRVDEDAYVNEIVRRLLERGICAQRGGPSDEVGIKTSNGESWQFDIHLSNGRPRRSGYTAYCRPARF